MDHIERFYATIERKPVDRPASWLGIPDQSALPGLYNYFKVNNYNSLKAKINDDLYPVEMPYHSPTSNAIYTAFDFAKKSKGFLDGRTLTTPGFFEDYSDPLDVEKFDWPNPELYIDIDLCKKVVDDVPKNYAVLGVLWSCHFQDACAAFGMENALVKMLTAPDIFREVIRRIKNFYLKANELFYESTKGKIHAILIGNDFGSQTALMVDSALLREFVFDGIRELIAQAKSYGLKVIYHSCGSIHDLIPDLIDAGADAIHPIQALAYKMEPFRLQKDFGNRVSFCGGVDAQQLLINGTPEQVKEKVNELKRIFPTGLIISPSHEAILADTNPVNIEALFQAVNNSSISAV
jgi:uroporphyrinogen decarboxylase